MTEDYVFKFGKYDGRNKTVEQMALSDYPYLFWILENTSHLSEQFYDHIRDVTSKLNNFVPEVGCFDCGDEASKISTAFSSDRSGVDYNVSGSQFYCSRKECLDGILAVNYKLSNIGFDSILDFPTSPRAVRREMHELLLKSAGFEGRKTAKNAKKFVEGLKLKIEQERFDFEENSLLDLGGLVSEDPDSGLVLISDVYEEGEENPYLFAGTALSNDGYENLVRRLGRGEIWY